MTNEVWFLITKTGLLIGRCMGSNEKGWHFYPHTTAHKPSRKAWPTIVDCIPDWAFNMSDDLLTADEWNARRGK